LNVADQARGLSRPVKGKPFVFVSHGSRGGECLFIVSGFACLVCYGKLCGSRHNNRGDRGKRDADTTSANLDLHGCAVHAEDFDVLRFTVSSDQTILSEGP